jgi:hypothetical protein
MSFEIKNKAFGRKLLESSQEKFKMSFQTVYLNANLMIDFVRKLTGVLQLK